MLSPELKKYCERECAYLKFYDEHGRFPSKKERIELEEKIK